MEPLTEGEVTLHLLDVVSSTLPQSGDVKTDMQNALDDLFKLAAEEGLQIWPETVTVYVDDGNVTACANTLHDV